MTNSPFRSAAGVYDDEPCKRTFFDDLLLHLEHGFVFSRPDFFVMGRAVVKGSADELIVDPTYRFPKEQCDCWHMYLFAGDMSKCFDIMPWPLKWVSMERRNELRYMPMEFLQRVLQQQSEEQS